MSSNLESSSEWPNRVTNEAKRGKPVEPPSHKKPAVSSRVVSELQPFRPIARRNERRSERFHGYALRVSSRAPDRRSQPRVPLQVREIRQMETTHDIMVLVRHHGCHGNGARAALHVSEILPCTVGWDTSFFPGGCRHTSHAHAHLKKAKVVRAAAGHPSAPKTRRRRNEV